MQPLNAVVKNGRLTLDEPCTRAEGEVVVLIPLDELLAVADASSDAGEFAFEVVSAPRQWRKPKAVDAAALIEELRSI